MFLRLFHPHAKKKSLKSVIFQHSELQFASAAEAGLQCCMGGSDLSRIVEGCAKSQAVAEVSASNLSVTGGGLTLHTSCEWRASTKPHKQ